MIYDKIRGLLREDIRRNDTLKRDGRSSNSFYYFVCVSYIRRNDTLKRDGLLYDCVYIVLKLYKKK